MPDLADGESTEVQGSGSNRYTLKNVGGVYSCSCPAWRNAGGGIERRTCKHLRAYRGDAAETERVGAAGSSPRPRAASATAPGEAATTDEPPLLLAHPWEVTQDPTGWWMSEKLDGVRAYWDGKKFISRLGNTYHAPDWFLHGLPDTPLDGELFGGRKKFQRTVGFVKRQDKGDYWKELRYVVFDAPALELPFEERLAHCREKLSPGRAEFAHAHEHERCEGVEHLRKELARVEGLGGEGLMLRQPGSPYHVGRSSTLLKVKTFHDAEARVLSHEPGKGKHKGRVGALGVETPEGTRFSVGTGLSDRERESPPPVGSIITYRYQELSEAGVPRFPSYVGVRDDYAWPGKTSKPSPSAKPPVPAPASHAAAPAPASTGATRRLELEDGKESQFWEATLEGSNYTVRVGRIGEAGESKTKSFARPELARAEVERIVARKLDEGWGQIDVPSNAVKSTTAAPAPVAPSRPVAPEPNVSAAPTSTSRARRFELVEGTSSKFWETSVAGTAHTVRFGRIGTNGQTKTKSFPTPERAAVEEEKLVAEKLKKGYTEVTGSGSPAGVRGDGGAEDEGDDDADDDE